MIDAFGRPFFSGDYLIGGGLGNRTAEYGLILYYVKEIVGDKMRLSRLKRDKSSGPSMITVKTAIYANSSKYLVVYPPPHVEALFNRFVDGVPTEEDHKIAAKWIHGRYPVTKWS